MTRAISNPINKLVAGIEAISSGKFDAKVDINSHDEFGYIAGNINDMADNLKKLIRERDDVTDELNELNSTLEERVLQKTQELEQVHNNLIRTEGLAIAGTVASSVAHELSTPFSTLKGYCELLSTKIPEELGLTKYCAMMEQEIDRCLYIMRGMTNLSRIYDDEKTITDINALIRDLLLFISLKAKSANISVKEELDPAIPHININTLGIRQVFMNIIINAIQATPGGGEIRITSSLLDADKKIKVSISDTGPGIPESELHNIFRTFTCIIITEKFTTPKHVMQDMVFIVKLNN